MLNRRPGGSAFCWLSLPYIVTNSPDLQLTDFLSSPSYIIIQLSSQSLEWHVWSSLSRNNCHAVHRSLSFSASVYECTMGFYLVPYRQPSPPTRFLLITAIGMCHFLPGHHFGMACLAGSKVNIQHLEADYFLSLPYTLRIIIDVIAISLKNEIGKLNSNSDRDSIHLTHLRESINLLIFSH